MLVDTVARARELSDSEERFRSLCACAPLGIFQADDEGRCLYTNARWQEMAGQSFSEALGYGWLNGVHPGDRVSLMDDWLAAATAGREYLGEFRFVRGDGSVAWVRARSAPVRAADGRLLGHVGTTVEITEQRRAERERSATLEALAAIESRFRALAEASLDLIVVFDPDCRFRYASPSAARILGIDPETLIGMQALDLVHRDDVSKVGEEIRRTAANPAYEAVVQGRVHRADGSLRVLEGRGRRLPGPGGEAGVLFVVRDVTDRVAVEEALRDSEDRYRRLVEVAPVAIVVHRDGKLLYVNPAAVELIGGASEKEIVGKPVLDFVHPEDWSLSVARVNTMLDTGVAAPPVEERLLRLDGTVVEVAVAVSPVSYDGSAAIQAVISDIGLRKRAQHELERGRDAALEASRQKSAFLASMSHELRTPLNVIRGHTAIIAKHLRLSGDATQQPSVEAISRAIERLLATIRDILDLSRIESGSFEIDPQPIDLDAFLRRHVADFEVLAQEKGLSLTCSTEASGAVVPFDEYCLAQTLANLIQNAVKFTEKGGVSVILGRDEDGDPCVEIHDTGIGMEPAYLARLCDPFSQEDVGFSRRTEGAGLGLSLVRNYVELNGARMSVESVKGQGSTFRVHFPSSRKGAAEIARAKTDTPRTGKMAGEPS